LVDSAVGGHTFKVESAILKFTELLSLRMKERGITTSALAEKINVKPPYVSKILRGTSNFTLDSIIKIASAVEADFVFDLVPKETNQKWNSFSGENVLVFRSNLLLGFAAG
jgi:transcriptional regulator with XRE-family HTH domain